LKILKKSRTARLNTEFTGSYKKVYAFYLAWAVNTICIVKNFE